MTPRPASSDSDLICLVQAGDRRAANELARRHFRTTWAASLAITGRSELADEAIQDAFERAFRHIDRVDPRRPFGAWLHRIVVNSSLDVLRRGHRDATVPQVDNFTNGADPIEQSAASRKLVEALTALDEDRRVVVVARLLFGYTPRETAQMLGIPVGTVNSRLSRALAQLRTVLGAAGVR